MPAGPMAAGQLRRKLTVQERSATVDSYGFATTDAGGAWRDVLTTWGAVTVRQQTVVLAVLAGQVMPTSAYVITLRYPPSVSIVSGMRVVDGGRAYTIENVVDVDERHRTLTLYCVEAPAPGA